MSCVIGLIEIEGPAESELFASDATLDFLFASLSGTAADEMGRGEPIEPPRSPQNRWSPPCPAICHVTRVEANLESLFDELDAQTAELVSRLVAARQQSTAE